MKVSRKGMVIMRPPAMRKGLRRRTPSLKRLRPRSMKPRAAARRATLKSVTSQPLPSEASRR